MATISARGFSVTVEFTERGKDWVGYYIHLMRENTPILNPRIYRNYPARDRSRLRGSGADASGESLIPLLEWGLKHNKAVCWKPTDPDVAIAIYPDDSFPLEPARPVVVVEEKFEEVFSYPGRTLAPNEVGVWLSEEAKAKKAAYEAEKVRRGGKHPNDPCCVIVKINSAVFGPDVYSSTGPALILGSQRREVERFVRDLKREYRSLKKTDSTIGGLRAFTRASPLVPRKRADSQKTARRGKRTAK
jgi:hypothetical protein